MSINSLAKIGNLYSGNDIKLAQNRYESGVTASINAVKDRELHPAVSSTNLCSTPLANKLDLLA